MIIEVFILVIEWIVYNNWLLCLKVNVEILIN